MQHILRCDTEVESPHKYQLWLVKFIRFVVWGNPRLSYSHVMYYYRVDVFSCDIFSTIKVFSCGLFLRIDVVSYGMFYRIHEFSWCICVYGIDVFSWYWIEIFSYYGHMRLMYSLATSVCMKSSYCFSIIGVILAYTLSISILPQVSTFS